MDADTEQILMTASLVSDMFAYAMTAMTLYVTAVSGYLLVAYFIGQSLTFIQVSTFTVLFLAFSGFMTYGAFGFFENAYAFGSEYGRGYAMPWVGEVAAITQGAGMIASSPDIQKVAASPTETSDFDVFRLTGRTSHGHISLFYRANYEVRSLDLSRKRKSAAGPRVL